MNVLPFQMKLRCLAALVEGASIRATERLTGVHRDTVMRLGVAVGDASARLHNALVRDVHANLIECDEIWTFVGKKQKRKTPTDDPEKGDQYVFTALDAGTKLLISYKVGKRTTETTLAFIRDLRGRVLGRPQITTDGLVHYRDAIDYVFGPDVDFAQVEKRYASGDPTPEAARRYSPVAVVNVEKTLISGDPDMEVATTSHVERANLTWRMGIRRFTRLTNAFSKKLAHLEAAFAVQAAYYNFCRVHEALRVTPAMQAGITDHVWSLAELLQTAFAMPVEPAPETPPPLTGLTAAQAKGVKSGTRSRGATHGLRIIQGRRGT
jgi:IS1 family transposase